MTTTGMTTTAGQSTAELEDPLTVSTARPSSAPSLAGLKSAGVRVGLGVALPFLLIMGGFTTLRVLHQPMLVWSFIGLGFVALVVAIIRRSQYVAWLLYLLGITVFGLLWERADNLGLPVRFEYAVLADRILGVGEIPTLRLQELLYSAGDASPLDWTLIAVYLTFFALPHLTLLVLWQSDRRLARSFVAALLSTLFLGLIVIVLVPTAPPWLAGQEGLTEPVIRVVRVIVDGVNPSVYAQGEQLSGSNPVAAMPSLHMAVTVVLGIAFVRGHRALRPLAIGYAVAMGFALVYLGEHYLVDVLAGVLTALLGWRVADRILGRSRYGEHFADQDAPTPLRAPPASLKDAA